MIPSSSSLLQIIHKSKDFNAGKNDLPWHKKCKGSKSTAQGNGPFDEAECINLTRCENAFLSEPPAPRV